MDTLLHDAIGPRDVGLDRRPERGIPERWMRSEGHSRFAANPCQDPLRITVDETIPCLIALNELSHEFKRKSIRLRQRFALKLPRHLSRRPKLIPIEVLSRSATLMDRIQHVRIPTLHDPLAAAYDNAAPLI